MTGPRTRTRTGAAAQNTQAPQAGQTAQSGTPSRAAHLRRGAEGRQQSHREAEEARKRRESGGKKANRFWLQSGESREVIVLDAKLDDVPFFYEHHLPGNDNKWKTFEPCIKEFTSCPICAGAGQKGGEAKGPYYAMFLTILDLTPYTDSKGVERAYSRRLLCVKNNQHPDFFRLFDQATKDHGRIRGMNLCLERGTDNNAPRIGDPVMLPDTVVMYEMLSEQELIEEFGHEAIIGEDKTEIYPKNGMLQPLDYDKLFPLPDPDDIQRRYGGGSGAPADDGWQEPTPDTGRRARRGAAPAAGGGAGATGDLDDDILF